MTQEALLSPQALAREFTEADLSPEFRANGSTNPDDATIWPMHKTGFAEWKLVVGGQVEEPLELSLAELRAMPSRTQITRHDCVEGWSCIGKWKGVPLSALLTRHGSSQKYGTSYSIAPTPGSTGTEADQYYESIDLADAFHAQTILAYEMNDQVLPVPYGAPLGSAWNASSATKWRNMSCASRPRQPRRHSRRARRVLGGSGLRVVRWNLRAKFLSEDS